ncbi:hypothetical protein SKAU_G00077680 [Synaphobranchus kaupii]|uniref:Uncharacterized protein n=1 Tax=Synaphobranchus kaupii TaxID=118154 RepID=A0A9Q1G8W9_SYNKA|nr:hypothetical protein SKAU_G00077680 [Synaphobranchus kaupii]
MPLWSCDLSGHAQRCHSSHVTGAHVNQFYCGHVTGACLWVIDRHCLFLCLPKVSVLSGSSEPLYFSIV